MENTKYGKKENRPLTILLPQTWDELLGGDHAHLLLLRGDAVEEVGQTGEKVLLFLLLDFIRQHILPERPAEIQSLQHWVTVTCVPKLEKKTQREEFI